MSATEFNARQLAVLAEARALGGWEVRASGRIFRPGGADQSAYKCAAREAAHATGWSAGSLHDHFGLTYREACEIYSANDRPTDPRRPALLRELGMEVTS
jgi:hypothetical protein